MKVIHGQPRYPRSTWLEWLTTVNHGKSLSTMINQSLPFSTMVNQDQHSHNGQTWLIIVIPTQPRSTMVNSNGQRLSTMVNSNGQR